MNAVIFILKWGSPKHTFEMHYSGPGCLKNAKEFAKSEGMGKFPKKDGWHFTIDADEAAYAEFAETVDFSATVTGRIKSAGPKPKQEDEDGEKRLRKLCEEAKTKEEYDAYLQEWVEAHRKRCGHEPKPLGPGSKLEAAVAEASSILADDDAELSDLRDGLSGLFEGVIEEIENRDGVTISVV